MDAMMTIKKYIALPFLFTTCLSLTACIDELTGDDDESVSSEDIEYAKSFTRQFNTLDANLGAMEEPMMEASSQVIEDTENLDQDAVEAAMVAVGATTNLAISLIENAAIYEGEKVIGLDFSQFSSNYALSELIAQECGQTCDESFDLSASGNVVYDNNQLIITNAVVTVDRYDVVFNYLGNSEWVEERDDFIGEFENTVSLTINLPDENLNNNNELSIAISNLSVESGHTNFSFGIDRLAAEAQFDTGSLISLNDLLNASEDDDLGVTGAAIFYELENMEMVLDQISFNGNLTVEMTLDEGENTVGAMAGFSIDGKLTNSKGESLLAKYSASTEVENSENRAEMELDLLIELTFTDQNQEELILGFKLDTEAAAVTDQLGDPSELTMDMLTEVKVISGDQGYIISYGLGGEFDGIGNEMSGDTNAFVKIQDATRTDKDFYIILNLNLVIQGSSEPEVTYTSGVYVNDALVGEWDFDEFENTQTITFDDEVIVLGEENIAAR